MMCFLVEFWDVGRLPQPPIKPMSEPYIDFEWPLAGWCIHLPQVSTYVPACPCLHPCCWPYNLKSCSFTTSTSQS